MLIAKHMDGEVGAALLELFTPVQEIVVDNVSTEKVRKLHGEIQKRCEMTLLGGAGRNSPGECENMQQLFRYQPSVFLSFLGL